jgi:hypothetical protein
MTLSLTREDAQAIAAAFEANPNSTTVEVVVEGRSIVERTENIEATALKAEGEELLKSFTNY